MTNIRFPARRLDGSFCVIATFECLSEHPEETSFRVDEWLAKWTDENEEWIWEYETGRSDTFRLYDELKRSPQVASCTKSELAVKIEGQPTSSSFWRDWFALKLVPELQAAFPDIRTLRFVRDCTSSNASPTSPKT